MNSERVAGCDAGPMPRCPARSSVVASRGRGNIHARRSQWIALPSSADDWPVPPAAAPRPNSSSRCAAITTRAVLATISATGSRLIRPRRLRSAASWPLSWWAVTSMPPDNVKGRPPVPSREGGPNAANSVTITAANVTPGKGRRRAARRREAITCRVSLLLPCAHRKMWHYLCRCPQCGSPHLGRARELAGVTGTRRLPCGHWIVVVVARTYGRTDSGAAA